MKHGCEPHSMPTPAKNGEGYADMTAYEAMKNLDGDPEYLRFRKVLWTLYQICDLAGYKIVGRIRVKNKKTGRILK